MVRKDVDVNDLLRLYRAGYSVKKLAEHFNIARSGIVLRLQESGIIQRGRSESMVLRMSQTSPEERARLASAAHAAVRGVRRSEEEMIARAKANESRKTGSRTEEICLEMLTARGLVCTPQKAIGRYNIDIAVEGPSIAVDIFGGNWHAYGRHAARYLQRVEYILDQGWFPVVIWVTGSAPLERGAIDYVVALAEQIGRGESVRREDQMILGNGEPTTAGKNKFYGRTVVPGPQPRDNATGRFEPRTRK